MSSMDWYESRRWRPRSRLSAEDRAAIRERRAKRRDLARLALAASLVGLGVIGVELGLKALKILNLAI